MSSAGRKRKSLTECLENTGPGVSPVRGTPKDVRHLLYGGDRVPLAGSSLLGRHVIPFEYQVPVKTCRPQRRHKTQGADKYELCFCTSVPHGLDVFVFDVWTGLNETTHSKKKKTTKKNKQEKSVTTKAAAGGRGRPGDLGGRPAGKAHAGEAPSEQKTRVRLS